MLFSVMVQYGGDQQSFGRTAEKVSKWLPFFASYRTHKDTLDGSLFSLQRRTLSQQVTRFLSGKFPSNAKISVPLAVAWMAQTSYTFDHDWCNIQAGTNTFDAKRTEMFICRGAVNKKHDARNCPRRGGGQGHLTFSGNYKIPCCAGYDCPAWPTAPPAPTPAPTKRTFPPVAQVACDIPGGEGLCNLPSEEYCCYVAGGKICITDPGNQATCGECACADPDTSAAARPASGAAALLAALLILAASL
jgi:hypothetical protein